MLLASLLLALAALISSACKSGYPVAAKQNENREARPVKTTRVTEVPMEQVITVSGTLAAYEQATISAKVAGRMREISVDLGSPVRKGQIIAQLEPKDYQLRLEQAEAALAQARARLGLPLEGTDDRVNPENTATVRQAKAVLDEARLKHERSLSLFQQGIISKSQLDTDEAEYKVAEGRYQDAIEEIRNRQALLLQRRSEVDLARQQLSDLSIKAAFDGVVEVRHAEIGEYLASGAPVVTIVRNNPLRLRAEVPERESRGVRAGQPVRVTVEGDANIYTGRIARLSPSISAQNRVLLVEAEVINNGQLRPGAFVRADIVTDAGGMTVAVPINAIVSFAGIDKVIMIEDGKAAEKPVTLGRRAAEWVEVLSGVKVGDTIVVDPGNLQSGQPVTVAE
ncbi:MAG TPA: efflux RND transporter periplasmic adaptor subunit [Blastocatellia bacterium]|nr:efflux RND transporter periplasmic adaptor subunit [Blastocatellia bacterium]